MKVEITFKKNPAETELGVQNWVFLRRSKTTKVSVGRTICSKLGEMAP